MLRMLPEYKNASLLRSRDGDKLEQCHIIVDVQGKYDGVKHFDHHQRGFQETFSSSFKTKLSSAGLVYKHFGQDIISSHLQLSPTDTPIQVLYNKIYVDMIEALDANDNGVSAFPGCTPLFKEKALNLPSQVAALHPWWNEPNDDAEMDRRFELAVQLMGGVFRNRLEYLGKAWMPARDLVSRALSNRKGEIIIFEQSIPWKEHLFELERLNNIEGLIKYVIYSDSRSWRVQAVPIDSESFESRKPLPEAWRGLRDEELARKCRVANSVFVHASGFIGGNKTREGAIEMAELAL